MFLIKRKPSQNSIAALLPIKSGTELWQQKEQTIADAEVPTHGVLLLKSPLQ